MKLRLAGAVLALCVLVPTGTAAAPSPDLPRLPSEWPRRLELGMSDSPGGAAGMARATRFGFRYQYLAGGVNTGEGWATWNEDGNFVTYYIEESIAHDIVPFFSYYMLLHSRPGGTDEADADYRNLQNRDTMRVYYEDLALFFQRAGAFDETVVLQVEPDLWGYMQQRAGTDPASTIPAQVAATGMPELEGLPDDLVGFAAAIDRLRDRYAPNVLLGYHMSVWGTGVDIQYSDPPGEEVDALATRAGRWFRSLQSDFDFATAEFSDRDAAFKEHVYGDGGASWWKRGDFRRHVRFLRGFVNVSRKRVVLWQIPLGNTVMRAMNNTWNHYQDNRVQWLLGSRGRRHLRSYKRAGVVAFLFGGGATGTTCACDAAADGVTNPPPINGNTRRSFNADDDGGYFRRRARRYYRVGALRL